MTNKLNWLNYRHLECFVAVVEEGGLVPAANRLNVSHPTVSEQIKKLEEHFELSLFERQGRRLQLTDAGKMVYGYAEQVFGVGAALLEAVDGQRLGRTVSVRVGVDSVLAKLAVRQLLSPLFDIFGEALRFRCIEDERERLFARLTARQLDLVLSDSPAHLEGRELQTFELRQGGIAFFGGGALRKLKRRFPASLEGAPFLLPMPTTRLRRELERWLGQQGIVPRVVAEIEDSGLIKAFGQEGRGVFVMPDALRDDVAKQYGVTVIGRVGEIETRVFAIVGKGFENHIAVQKLLAHHGAPSRAESLGEQD